MGEKEEREWSGEINILQRSNFLLKMNKNCTKKKQAILVWEKDRWATQRRQLNASLEKTECIKNEWIKKFYQEKTAT